MSGEQKYKEGDGPWLQWEASNRDELLVFTDRQQCYKARLSDFDDSKASLLGDFLPTKLGMDPGEGFVWACVTADYSGHLLFFFENGKVARVACRPIRPRPAARSSRRLLRQVPPGGGLPADRGHGDGGDLHRGPGGGLPHRRPHPQDHPLHPGGQRHDPQAQVQGGRARPLADTTIVNAARYRARSLPIAGMLLRPEDRAEEQMTLLE